MHTQAIEIVTVLVHGKPHSPKNLKHQKWAQTAGSEQKTDSTHCSILKMYTTKLCQNEHANSISHDGKALTQSLISRSASQKGSARSNNRGNMMEYSSQGEVLPLGSTIFMTQPFL